MSLLTYKERAEHWEWMRAFIDREAIYRVDDTHPALPPMDGKSRYTLGYYLRRATLDAEFAHRLGLLFWDEFAHRYRQQPFQVCAAEPSGPPIACAIQAAATRLGVPLNVFTARREAKGFGLDNWFDGRIIPGLPVVMVDDIAASAPFLLRASIRVQQKLALPLHSHWFTVVAKVGPGIRQVNSHTRNYLDGALVSLFTHANFCRDAADYAIRYGQPQCWSGVVK